MYVVLGIVNPTSNIPFTITLYEYYTSATHYGVTINQANTANYIIDNSEALASKVVLPKSSIRMYPYNTKITRSSSGSVISPIRMWFQLPATATTQLDYISNTISTTNNGMFQIVYPQATDSPYQECYFKEYDSWTNLIQRTQSRLFYAACSSSGTTITVYVPKVRPITNAFWYELIVYPLSTSYNIPSGYDNLEDDIRVTAYQTLPAANYAAQTIQRCKLYQGTSRISLVRAYVVTNQPLTRTSIQI
jgi:hypothetical protein